MHFPEGLENTPSTTKLILVHTSQLMQFCTGVNLRDTEITWGHLIIKV